MAFDFLEFFYSYRSLDRWHAAHLRYFEPLFQAIGQPTAWLSLATDQQPTICACTAMTDHAQIGSCCSVTNNNHAFLTSGGVNCRCISWFYFLRRSDLLHYVSSSSSSKPTFEPSLELLQQLLASYLSDITRPPIQQSWGQINPFQISYI